MTYSIAVPVTRAAHCNDRGLIIWPRERYRILDVEAPSPWEALEFVEKAEGVKCCRVVNILDL